MESLIAGQLGANSGSSMLEFEHSSLVGSIEKARNWLLERQHEDGYWLGELEGDTILESEYVLLLAWLGRHDDAVVTRCAEYILQQQLPDGGWALYPGGPLEMSGSVKAYWVLKLAGYDPESEPLTRARNAILAAGGAEKVNSFTRYYMALLGVISYQKCPAVPPELMMLPNWFPINIYEMSSWSRTIVVPLSLLWAFQPKTTLEDHQSIRELFVTSPEEMPLAMPPSEQLDSLKRRSWFPWTSFFQGVDRVWKGLEWLGIKPFRKRSVELAHQWMMARFEKSDGLGAIFPPIIWSVIALRCLGYEEDAPEVMAALEELEKLSIHEGNTTRLEPCKSPVWDTSISLNALRLSGVPASHPQLRKAVNWLLSKEVRQPGDWSIAHPDVQPGGWYFEFNNEFYPDVDDTIMVTMALFRCLPGGPNVDWSTKLLAGDHAQANSKADAELSVMLNGTAENVDEVVKILDEAEPILAAMRRAVDWIHAMQCRNGGWAAFDADNDREILTRVPFADHNAMIDPPTADITARVLEMIGVLGQADQCYQSALDFVWSEQEPDDCWYGRWGVNYLYGTWQVLVGLTEFGVPPNDERLQRAVAWLKSVQQEDGGWGETPRSYDQPELRGTGPTTASQTAWAIMGLIAGGAGDSESVTRGIEYLLRSQRDDGTWDEPWFTGTGFPRVFYLRYHLYRHYFPLMALGKYATVVEESLS